MKKIRKETFETNSSSTHSLTICNSLEEDYKPYGSSLKIRWIDTDDEYVLTTLKDKVSYLVSHIASWYMYNAENYDELINEVKNNWDFKRIESYLKDKYNLKIVFPKYDGDIEELVSINHQLITWNNDLNDVLRDLVDEERDYLSEVLEDGKCIEFGRD